jgi:polar amino acid transport system substrate-binding protein
MHRSSSRSLTISLTLALALLLAACGGADDTTDGGDAAAADDDVETVEGDAAADLGVDLVEDGQLTFAMSGQYRPFNYYDESGDLVGFDVDMGNEIAERLGLEPNPVTGDFDALIAGLTSGRYDAIIGSMTATPEREEQVDFTEVYYVSGAQLFVDEGSEISSLDDLQDGTVGVTRGTTFEDYARDEGVGDVTTYPSDNQALTELESGRVDAVITNRLLGLFQIEEAGLDVVAVGDVLFDDTASIAVRKDTPELREAIDEALREAREDGAYARISEEWFGVDIG